MSRGSNPYISQFNSGYNRLSGISVIPYQQSQVRNDVDSIGTETKNYSNKFFDEKVYQEGEPSIELTPAELEEIRRSRLRRAIRDDRIYTQTYISYINIDSAQRDRYPVNVYDENLYELPPYPIIFTANSSIVTIELPKHPFIPTDRIALSNVIAKNVILHNVISVKKNSLFVRINQNNHGLSLFGQYNPSDPSEFEAVNYVDILPESFNETDNIPDGINQYYILKKNLTLDFTIQLSGVKGSNFDRTMIGNIPINYLNRRQTVILLFTKSETVFVEDPNNYLIMLERKSSINYRDGTNFITDRQGNATSTVSNNTIYIKFYNLFGIPLNYLNSGTPINEDRKYPYLIVLETTVDTFTVDVHYQAIVDPSVVYSFYSYSDLVDHEIDPNLLIGSNRGGGNQCYVRRIISSTPGYPNPNNYKIILDRSYKNIIQARIISSIFPNSRRRINGATSNQPCVNQTTCNNLNNTGNGTGANNRLYWRNLSDGNWIYYLEIKSGNYNKCQLAEAIKEAFDQTIRYQYTIEYETGVDSNTTEFIIQQSTPIDNTRYDINGYYKYHIVDVEISETTDIVSFASYRQLIQHNAISIPDYTINFTMAENLGINFGNSGTQIVPQNIAPFNPTTEVLYIYFTSNSHLRIDYIDFPYAINNLYKYIEHIPPSTITTSGTNTFQANLDLITGILVNFYRNLGTYPDTVSTQEINSINTSTLLQNFTYNYLTSIVFMPNHQLKSGDIIITDQFINPSVPNAIFVYEITNIIDNENFEVIRYDHGTKYKFIYDSLIINFNQLPITATSAYYWLDQQLSSVPIDQPPPNPPNHNTLSFVEIEPTPENKRIMIIYQPNHQLHIGDKITIANSISINRVPADVINQTHIINRIIDDDHYEILLDIYNLECLESTCIINPESNPITITFPDVFQMFFNFSDTLGFVLSFNKVGQNVAITPYKHVIKNTYPYANDYNYDTLGAEFEQGLSKINLVGFNYFYISSPELGYYRNTDPVTNVFAKIRWFQDQGEIIFDSFVPSVKYYDPVLSYLSEIDVTMYNPDGSLVEFNGLDHSFTIEIVEVYNQPDETDINARINAAMIVRRA